MEHREMEHADILIITDANLDEVRNADLGVLILTKTDCGYCAQYQQEITALRERGRLQGPIIGKILLDRPGSLGFKRDNAWLAGVTHLPYTLVYRHGARIDEFDASKGSYLAERVADLERPSDVQSAS
jgi:hypothetical protein